MTQPATSAAEPIATTIPAAILETILARLTTIFLIGAGGDFGIAREAARQLLASYRPSTQEELCLAASIISFGFQALEALGQSAAPDMPLTKILRLRGGAVSLSREADKARARLTQLQKSRPETRPEPEPVQAKPLPAAVPPKKLTWTQLNQHRERDRRLAARQKKAQAHAARPTPSPANQPQVQPAPAG